ncbi:MAG: phosphate ABC transporter permease subunit PstC [Nitrososphaerota archaeon]|jgi:phosphate transport system permease protein|nr:phosphate ABC transporter permease subunit PstC [Nitrososphaerota archaeon]
MTKLTGDNIFKCIVAVIAAFAAIILIVNAYVLITGSVRVFSVSGFGFISGRSWNPGASTFGVLPAILGTLITSGIALLVGVPLSLGIAIFIVEMAPRAVRVPFSYLIEMLAAVPSVIYGLWGMFVLRFWVLDYIETPLNTYLGWFPLFSGTPTGYGFLTAGLILAIMIIPTIASVSREVISAVPNSIKEAAYGIGATKGEVIHHWVLSYGRSGIFGAIILGLGRAIGETMAVTMVIGNAAGAKGMPVSLFQPGQTLPSLIAGGFFDSQTPLQSSAYIGAGLVLLVISLLINIAAHVMVTRVLKVKGGAIE